MKASVQIFIPTFNRCKLLINAIQSVLDQTYKEIEIIVLDNASTDETYLVLSELITHHKNIRYVRNEKNVGMLGNFNKIKELVSSEYFCFLTDDDTYKPKFIEFALNKFIEHPSATAVVMRAPTVINGVNLGCTLDFWNEGLFAPGEGLENCLNGHHPIITNCVFSKCFSNEFYFEEDLSLSGDGYVCLKLFGENFVYVSQEESGFWDCNPDSASQNDHWQSTLKRKIYTQKHYSDYLISINKSNLLDKVPKIGLISIAAQAIRNSESWDVLESFLIEEAIRKKTINYFHYKIYKLAVKVGYLFKRIFN